MDTREQALKCAKWEWMAGMHTSDGALVVSVEDGRPVEVVFDGELRLVCEPGRVADDYDDGYAYRYDMAGVTPRWTESTLGCIEHGLLPKAWAVVGEHVEVEVVCTHIQDETTGARSRAYRCHVLVWESNAWSDYWITTRKPSRVEALLAALEAAPR